MSLLAIDAAGGDAYRCLSAFHAALDAKVGFADDGRPGWSLAKRLQVSRKMLADLAMQDSATRSGGNPAEVVARELRLPLVASVDPERLIVRERFLQSTLRRPGGADVATVENADGPSTILVAPERAASPELRAALRAQPALAQRLAIAARKTLRDALVTRAEPQLLRQARDGLFDRFPELSARIVANFWQGSLIGGGIVLLPIALLLAPVTTTLLLHGFFSILFFSCVFLRLAASRCAGPIRFAPLKPVAAAELPVYTILVALRHEAEIVPDLLVALGRLHWPRNKLEIKLVCEADDLATIGVLEAQQLRPYVEIVKVPPAGPRTKPKALAYALQLATGEFVALYDAEDRPHPLQLIEAWQRFRETDSRTACVQAPLVISNWNRGMLQRMFAFEYAALFRGLLPWLSRRDLIFPLGGTSNHFRRAALDEVGGWDPYNVTEDADLGLKLHRFGFRTGTISRPTYEDAPDDLGVWVRQRTRWFKGWLLTWLVHMRNPSQLARELGPGSFLVAQVLFAGMVASALVHPLLAVSLAGVISKLAWDGEFHRLETVLLVIDAFNLACGYLGFLLLARNTLTPQERAGFWKTALWTPVYWLLMSAAAWRSIWQLHRQPHLWEKTPHRPHRAVMAEAPGAKLWSVSPSLRGLSEETPARR